MTSITPFAQQSSMLRSTLPTTKALRLTATAAMVAAALLLTACAAPELKRPQIDMPIAFKEAPAPLSTPLSAPLSAPLVAADGSLWHVGQPAEAQPRGQWWLAFNDPTLNQLIVDATAANANQTLAVSAARVKQARAIAGIASADLTPQVGANLSAQRGRAAPLSLGLPEGTNVAPATYYKAGLGASYEVDLFGRVAANVNASAADADASQATYRSVLLALQADVAQTWFRLRATDAELATLRRTVTLREESVHVTQRRFELGDIGEFDLARAKTELATTRAEAIGLQRQRTNNDHALAVLLGRPASSFTASVQTLDNRASLPIIPSGMPSALLERRPDIAAAQKAMVAANERIGVARSAMFPSLSLNASSGGQAGGLADVFAWSSRTWLLGALMSVPLIDGGRNQANIARSEAVLEESVALYRQSVLVAFADVEDQLASLRILAGQAEQIDIAVVAAGRSADLAQKLYSAGRSGYLEWLDAQRNLASIERSAVQLRGQRASTTVALIRALGGGWD
jgi:multidrug efflux system outer membrane protein